MPLPGKANVCGRQEMKSSIFIKLNLSYLLETQVQIRYMNLEFGWKVSAVVLEVICISLSLKAMELDKIA